MFKTKNSRIDVKDIFVNGHVLDMFKDRKKRNAKFGLPGEITIALLSQRSKNNNEIQMKKLRGAITLKGGLFLIVNIYEKDGVLSMKALSCLTLGQIKGSYNFSKGEYLRTGYICKSPEIIEQEKYFNEEYTDFLEKIEWEDCDVQYL